MDKLLKYLSTLQLVKLFQHPPYLFFILSVIFSQFCINMMNIIFISQIYNLTGSNFLVSILILTFVVPQMFLSFIGGVIADVRNKRKILIYGNVLRSTAFVLLFFNTQSALLIYIVSILVSIITQFYIPAETPLIPNLIDKKYLTAANSLFGIALFGSVLLGYVMSGPLVLTIGYGNVFLLIAFLLIASALFISFIPNNLFLHQEKVDLGSIGKLKISIVHELKNTYKILFETKQILTPCLLLAFSQVIVLMLATIMPGYATTILEIPTEELSFVIFAPAALGMLVASLGTGSVLGNVSKQKLITIGVLMSGCVLMLFPYTTRIVTKSLIEMVNAILPGTMGFRAVHFAGFLSFLAGFANALIFVPSQTIIQEKLPENFRSKVYGLLFGIIGIFSLVPILLTGGLADILGVGVVLFIVGALLVLSALFRIDLIKSYLFTGR